MFSSSRKIISKIILVSMLFTLALMALPGKALAQTEELKNFGKAAYGESAEKVGEEGPVFIAGKIINAALGIVGIIMVILFVYGGFLWMTAGGNEERVKKATQVLSRAVIGLIIILLAYSISYFVMQQILKSTGVPAL